ncbi:hypothetical protein [Undibacterium pigrum]|uniref:hypothetical protein n=1 Tax=Undibacterium pigrum TaxID=401470 RepID=UPI000D75E9F6|nr:hypothetical protein [Undibacterium pigrum]
MDGAVFGGGGRNRCLILAARSDSLNSVGRTRQTGKANFKMLDFMMKRFSEIVELPGLAVECQSKARGYKYSLMAMFL